MIEMLFFVFVALKKMVLVVHRMTVLVLVTDGLILFLKDLSRCTTWFVVSFRFPSFPWF